MPNILSPERCQHNLTQLIFLQCLSSNGCPGTCHSSPHTYPSCCSMYGAWQGSTMQGDKAPLQLQKAGSPGHYLTWPWNRGAKTSYQHYWALIKTSKEHRCFGTTCLFWQKGEAPLHWIFEALLFKDWVPFRGSPRRSDYIFTLCINNNDHATLSRIFTSAGKVAPDTWSALTELSIARELPHRGLSGQVGNNFYLEIVARDLK